MEFVALLAKLDKILDELKIDYLITGGIAVGAWSRPRHTADIDIIVEIVNAEKVGKLIVKLKENFKGYIDIEQAQDALRRRGEFNMIEQDYGIKIDFWFSTGSGYDKEKFCHSRQRKIGGRLVRFISPEDLIISKLIWSQKAGGSERQIDDIKSVLAVQGKRLDKKYLQKWIGKLDLENEWKIIGE